MHAQPRYDERTRTQVKHAVLERISLRGIERLFGMSRHTVADWIEDWAEHLPPLETTLAAAQVDDMLELDEAVVVCAQEGPPALGLGRLVSPYAADCRLLNWRPHRGQLLAPLATHSAHLDALLHVQRFLGGLSTRLCH